MDLLKRGDYHQGVPAITVIVGGRWSKHSHHPSYNAKYGVGIIIGQATGKLLHIGVHNRYCTTCTQGVPQEKHEYFKHCSFQMESDIILEGFKQAEAVHDVRFIGDSDSSVYSTLISVYQYGVVLSKKWRRVQ